MPIDRRDAPPDHALVQYGSRQYGTNQRYLTKALREVARRMEGAVVEFDEQQLSWRPADDQWCATEIVGFLRDSEREDLRNVQAMLARDGAHIEERRAYHGPDEEDYRWMPVEELWWDFATMREDMVWTLRTAGAAWDHFGSHDFRGDISVEQYVREINERDLDSIWKLYTLQEQTQSVHAARRPTRRARPARGR